MPDDSDTKRALAVVADQIAAPLYRDAISPGAIEVGRTVQTIGRALNLALSPLSALVWGWESINEFLKEAVTKKLNERNVPSERLGTPSADVFVPAVEAMRYSLLRDQFAALIATAVDTASAENVHPSFVEVLKQLRPDEATLIAEMPDTWTEHLPLVDIYYANGPRYIQARNIINPGPVKQPERCAEYIDNLARLGLIEVSKNHALSSKSLYEPLRALPQVKQLISRCPTDFKTIIVERYYSLTSYGLAFRRACIAPSEERDSE